MALRIVSLAVGVLGLVFLPLGAIGAERSTEAPAGGDSTSLSAGDLVQSALEFELHGQSDRRAELLKEAVSKAPDSAPAHWQSGEVLLEGKWLTVEQAQERMHADATLAEYRRLRDQSSTSAADQAALARWCKKNKLSDEEQTHWRAVLAQEPNNQEAVKRLGLQKHQGMMLMPAQIARAKSDAQAARQAMERLRPLVSKWRAAVERGDTDLRNEVLSKVRAIREPAEMIGLEQALWQHLNGKEHQRTYETVSMELVSALKEMPQQAAIDSLARHAVLSPFEKVRLAATEGLKKRPLDSFIPLLLAGLATPIEANVSYETTYEGRPVASTHFFREGALADMSVTMLGSAQTGAVEQTNEAIADRNARIIAALAETTGLRLGDDPMKWWTWWLQDYNEMYEIRKPDDSGSGKTKAKSEFVYGNLPTGSPVAPTIVTGATRTSAPVTLNYTDANLATRITAGRIMIRECSCFARGTKVSTSTGLVAIENVKRGDRVLSQDAETGELAFKPVIGVTVREPGPRIKIGVGKEEIVATPSHPFWIDGQGWLLAKQLTPGMRLHGLLGGLEIPSLEDVPAPPEHYEGAYNLIVADFSTYFVGAVPMLVHDNSQRRPATVPVPGLRQPIPVRD